MFIIELTYKKPIKDVERVLEAHVEYLEKYYLLEKFICSGRKNPRTGGIIFCNASDAREVKKIIAEDPFSIEDIADYKVIEFSPTKYLSGFDNYLN